MYEDLTLGGEGARSVLDGLSGGPTGEDEENDHIHRLLQLLGQPEPTVESATRTPAEPATEATEDFTAAALVESVEAATEAAPEAVVQEAERDAPAGGHATSHKPSGLINFLQEDELAETDKAAPATNGENAEEDFEIVPSMKAHEVSTISITQYAWEADRRPLVCNHPLRLPSPPKRRPPQPYLLSREHLPPLRRSQPETGPTWTTMTSSLAGLLPRHPRKRPNQRLLTPPPESRNSFVPSRLPLLRVQHPLRLPKRRVDHPEEQRANDDRTSRDRGSRAAMGSRESLSSLNRPCRGKSWWTTTDSN